MNARFSNDRLALSIALGAFALLLCTQSAAAKTTPWPCTHATLLEAGTAWASASPIAAEGDVVAVTVTEPGWLALQADGAATSETGSAGVDTWLELLAAPCGGDTLAPIRAAAFLDQGLVEIREPGTLYLRLGSVDRMATSQGPSLRLSTHLLTAAPSSIIAGDGGPGAGTEDPDGEVLPIVYPGEPSVLIAEDGGPGTGTEDPDGEVLPIVFPGDGCWTTAYRSAAVTSGRIFRTKDGGPGTGTEDPDGEVLPIVLPGDGCQLAVYRSEDLSDESSRLTAIIAGDGGPGAGTEDPDGEVLPIAAPGAPQLRCQAGEPANDFLLCAVGFGADGRAAGRVDLVEGLDRDYFAFTLDRFQHVRITARGTAAARGTLLDAHGRILATDEPGPTDEVFTIDATLVPGHYYLRVDATTDQEGSYRLQLASRDRS